MEVSDPALRQTLSGGVGNVNVLTHNIHAQQPSFSIISDSEDSRPRLTFYPNLRSGPYAPARVINDVKALADAAKHTSTSPSSTVVDAVRGVGLYACAPYFDTADASVVGASVYKATSSTTAQSVGIYVHPPSFTPPEGRVSPGFDRNPDVTLESIVHEVIVGYCAAAYALRAYKGDATRGGDPSGQDTSAAASPEATKKPAVAELVIILPSDVSVLPQVAQKASATVAGMYLARDLVNAPPNVLYPQSFGAVVARAFPEVENVTVEVLQKDDLEHLGMHAILAVGAGSSRPPAMAVLRYKAEGADVPERPVVLVGKGVTMDTGGICVKGYPGGLIHEMKMDMGGAAVCAGTLMALAASRAPVHVAACLMLVENMPDGAAYRPGDVLKSAAGITIEVHNTDAEGRVALCDGLWYAQKHLNARAVIDVATLTGAAIVALGHEMAAVCVNSAGERAGIVTGMQHVGRVVDEEVWQLPQSERYAEHITSTIADIKNVGTVGVAGTIAAGQFLNRFISPRTPWAHLDVAGVHFRQGHPLQGSAGTRGNPAWGVRLLSRYLATTGKF
eukprot:TRINITY_DN32622_c0_g1_i1.p1 TRINITY_DN32622_c0_g1~~TRINITY_DN32622_c0_g1_i1.p1  ORF type:complete len:562 (+),score=128.17 TRINITY_DN32622_c0_g1_i1:241-1926(+)